MYFVCTCMCVCVCMMCVCVCCQVKEVNLRPRGSFVKVTQENKERYVDLMVEWKLAKGTREQAFALRKVRNYLHVHVHIYKSKVCTYLHVRNVHVWYILLWYMWYIHVYSLACIWTPSHRCTYVQYILTCLTKNS